MAKVLSGITHAIVRVPSYEEAANSNTFAIVDFCFGPGDDTAISGLRLVRDGKNSTSWQTPMYDVYRNGRPQKIPVFKGVLLAELTQLAARALARIKSDLGSSAWGTKYTIYPDRVEVSDLSQE